MKIKYQLVANWRSTKYYGSNICFSATVANLQAKVESLTTTNALMKEDLAISKNTMISLVEENNQLKHALGESCIRYLA